MNATTAHEVSREDQILKLEIELGWLRARHLAEIERDWTSRNDVQDLSTRWWE